MRILGALAMITILLASPVEAQPIPVILDTDIGDDVDDAYALALLASLPDVRILGVTTTFGQTAERAEVAAKLLSIMGREDIPVHAGRRGDHRIGRQHEWAKGFRSRAIRSEPAVEFIRRQIDRNPGQVTLIAIGPLTNVGDLMTKHPDCRGRLKQIVIMGGAVRAGYSGSSQVDAEWNIKCDPAAARAVYESGVPLTMAGLEVTAMMKLDEEMQKQLFAAGTRMTDALAALTNLWGNRIPTLFDPVAVAWATGHRFADPEPTHVVVTDDGFTRPGEGAPNVNLLVRPRKEEFLAWYVRTVKGGPARK